MDNLFELLKDPVYFVLAVLFAPGILVFLAMLLDFLQWITGGKK